MFSKEISYEDFNGKQQKETIWFHMSEAEIIEWTTMNGDYSMDAVLTRMVEKNRTRDLIESIRDLIYKSYGEKSLDGKRFIKSKEVKDAFMESPAYSELFMELLTDAKACADFVKGLIPKKWRPEVERLLSENNDAAGFSVVKSE